jgi:hypothetical protein
MVIFPVRKLFLIGIFLFFYCFNSSDGFPIKTIYQRDAILFEWESHGLPTSLDVPAAIIAGR